MTFIGIVLMFAVVLFVLFWAGIIVAVFFHREIAAVRLARNLGEAVDAFQCKCCGKCCRLNITTDKQTVADIAGYTGRPVDEFAKKLPMGSYLLKKRPDGGCALHESTDSNCFSCAAYPVRPDACRRFPFLLFPGRIKGLDARCPHLPGKDSGGNARLEPGVPGAGP